MKMIEDYINMTRLLVLKHGASYLYHYSLGELLSYAYEALMSAYNSFDGRGDIDGWISYKIKKTLLECSKPYRMYPGLFIKGRGGRADVEFVEFDESTAPTNGYEVQRMIDRQYIEYLMSKARLTERRRRRLKLYYLDGLTNAEIADIEGVTEAAICGANKRAIRKLRRICEQV